MLVNRLYLIFAVLMLISVLGCARAPEAGQKVLLIFSYHAEYPWVIEETAGLDEVLKDKRVEVAKFYMDTKRNTSAEWKAKVAEEAISKINDFRPNVVIVLDDNACELVAKRYIGTTLPFVFCGMNGEPGDYGFPATNITGVIERHHQKETINLLKRLVPDAKRAAMVTDNGPTSQAFVARAKRTALPIEIYEFYSTDDFDDWKAKVKELQSKVDAIGLVGYQTIRDKDGQVSVPAEDVLGWTLSNNKLPEFAFFDYTVRDGALCGVILSGYEQGKTAAEIAIKILGGEKPANIPIECPERGKPIINESRANELGIVIPKDLLEEVEIVR